MAEYTFCRRIRHEWWFMTPAREFSSWCRHVELYQLLTSNLSFVAGSQLEYWYDDWAKIVLDTLYCCGYYGSWLWLLRELSTPPSIESNRANMVDARLKLIDKLFSQQYLNEQTSPAVLIVNPTSSTWVEHRPCLLCYFQCWVVVDSSRNSQSQEP